MTKPRKHRIAATCTSCQRNFQTTPAGLLAALAEALNNLHQAGLPVKLKHGVAITRNGYVLPADGRWEPRTLAYMPFSPADEPPDGDD